MLEWLIGVDKGKKEGDKTVIFVKNISGRKLYKGKLVFQNEIKLVKMGLFCRILRRIKKFLTYIIISANLKEK